MHGPTRRVTPLVALLLLLVVCLAAPPALAQGPVTVDVDAIDVDGFPDCTARVTVIDENGLPVLGLKSEHFELVEDGQASVAPQRVEAVADSANPVTVLILIDLSVTMKGTSLDAAKDATTRFLDRLIDQPADDPDRAGFIGFGHVVSITAHHFSGDTAREVAFTNDKPALLNTINALAIETAGGTPLYDALYRGIKILGEEPGRRALVVMTDGKDVGSTLKQDDPIAEAQRQHIPVFPIGLTNFQLDATYLRRLAELTGGQFHETEDPDELAQKFQEVLARLKLGYGVSYTSQVPAEAAGRHSLLVRVNAPRGQAWDEDKFDLAAAVAPAGDGESESAESEGVASEERAAPTVAAGAAGRSEVGKDETGTLEAEEVEESGSWLSENALLLGGIGVAAVLCLALVVLAIVLMRKRSATTAAAGAQPAAWAAPADLGWGAQGSAPAPVEEPPAAGFVDSAPAGPPAMETGTWIAGTDEPVGFAGFAGPAPARAPAQRDVPADDGTVVLQRGAKRAPILAFLVDRAHPDQHHELTRPATTIGRAADSSIAISDATVSRQHAIIKLEGDAFRLYDLGSANGTFVDDVRVREPATLEDGATLRFGDVRFVFKRMRID